MEFMKSPSLAFFLSPPVSSSFRWLHTLFLYGLFLPLPSVVSPAPVLLVFPVPKRTTAKPCTSDDHSATLTW